MLLSLHTLFTIMSKVFVKNNHSYSKSDPIYCFIYGGVLIWLLPGLLRVSNFANIEIYLFYVTIFILASYIFFRKAPFAMDPVPLKFINASSLKWLIIVAGFIFPLLHWNNLGGLPVLEAFNTSNYMEIVLIRQHIFESASTFWRYGASFTVLSVLPFIVLLSVIRHSRMLLFTALFSLCYASSLMQKSYVIVVLLPAIIYAIAAKRLTIAIVLTCLSGAGVFTLMLATNPHLRPQAAPVPHVASHSHEVRPAPSVMEPSKSIVAPLLAGLIDRVVFVPGEVVGRWFDAIPVKLPYAYGCGYRRIAQLMGCEHVNFPEQVYALYNKDLVQQGVFGTMNVASFMEDYANFGLFGLIGGGIVLALLLYLLGVMFRGRRRIGVALNSVPLLYLSSGTLLSLLLSGGWLMTLVLYAIFHNEFNNYTAGEECVA